MNHLSLFTGAGGGELGAILLGWHTIGYVEYNDYCQKVISARINDGILPNAPIFGDIRAFNGEGYAASYNGLVDVLSAGFPCQPFSVAGKRKGADDERNMWPPTIRVIREVRPRYCLLENVPGLIRSGYFETILKDLAESGYDAKWKVISAAEVGAPHKRDRLWIVAYDKCVGWKKGAREGIQSEEQITEGQDIGDICPEGTESTYFRIGQSWQQTESKGWAVEPDVGRVAHGVACRVDRLKALGNGQVPQVVATAWEILILDRKEEVWQ